MNNAPSPCDSIELKGPNLEEDLASLSEMFPSCKVDTLRNYLEIFAGDPNYKTTIVNLLLESDSASGLNQIQNITQEQGGNYGLKRGSDAGKDSLQSSCTSGELGSPSKVMQTDTSTLKTYSSRSFQSSFPTASKEASPCKVFKVDFNDNKKTSSSKATAPHNGTAKTSNEESEIVFVKSVSSSPKPSFHRPGHSDQVMSSPRKGAGICIRYKGGTLHPSMNKSKKLQIVEINDDCPSRGSISDQSAMKKTHSSTHQSHDKKCSSTLATCPTDTASSDSDTADDDLPKFCSSKGLVSKEKTAKNNADVTRGNLGEHLHSNERSQVREVSSSNPESLPVLADLEILKKVFPEADPDYISSLLDEHAYKHDRVALVGKELAKNPNPQSAKKKLVSSVPWFWQSENGKLVPFTDSECNALEKEFNSHEQLHSGATSVKIRMPGSAKSYDVNFAAMIMTCEKGQKTTIVRVPCSSEDNKQTGSKILVPKEALAVPTGWQDQTNSVELICVRPGSAEWDHVQRSFKRSLRGAQVTDIQRVQNKWLYRKYAIQRHLIKDKNGPTCINEKELFHGTRHTSPDVIWRGEDGFDMRYSADGMWGRGTYFASEASYCHQGFVHYDPQAKQYQLFLAHVLTGDSISLPPDRNIKMPPPKRGSNIRYDSVNGVTNGCTVYILYKLDMAYPAYLINYTIND